MIRSILMLVLPIILFVGSAWGANTRAQLVCLTDVGGRVQGSLWLRYYEGSRQIKSLWVFCEGGEVATKSSSISSTDITRVRMQQSTWTPFGGYRHCTKTVRGNPVRGGTLYCGLPNNSGATWGFFDFEP